jgi:hypothetical protein
MFFRKGPKTLNLIDFSMQDVSTGQVSSMLTWLRDNTGRGFTSVKADYRNNEYGDTRCYLTTDFHDGRVIQWFKDRNPAQVEEFAQYF